MLGSFSPNDKMNLSRDLTTRLGMGANQNNQRTSRIKEEFTESPLYDILYGIVFVLPVEASDYFVTLIKNLRDIKE